MLLVWACYKCRAPIGTFVVFTTLLLLLATWLPPSRRAGVTTTSPRSTITKATITPVTTAKLRGIKYSRTVLTRNIYVGGYTRPHPELCPYLGVNVRLVVLVASAPSHITTRRAIRLTWGRNAKRHGVVVGFMIGKPQNVLRKALDREEYVHGDVIEGRYVDSYSNLTLKSISILEWMATYCPRAPRLLKTDDDTFVNIERVLQFVKAPATSNATYVVWGSVNSGTRPIRLPKHKYFVPPPGFRDLVFPDFAEGAAYLVTSDAVIRMAHAAGNELFFPLEDVFVTGLLAGKTGVRRKNVRWFARKQAAKDPCQVHRWMVTHRVAHHEQFNLWRNTISGKHKCHLPTII